MKAPTTTRRLLAAFLALILSLTCVPEAFAAESATAATMQLMKTEGTVGITNASGRKVSLIKNMKLRSGYHVTTEEESYSWINLDSSKLIKEDAVTEISIRKSGKKLEVLLDSGNLFFNVTEPLDEDESLNIRTSTMIVGIRGTSGWVKIIDQWTSELYVLEGTVTVTVTDPVTGEARTEPVTGGEKAVCKVYPQDTPGVKCEIIRDKYRPEDIDGFVLTEVAPDQPLKDKIEEESGLDLDGVDPEKRLKDDQEAVRKKLEEIRTKEKEQEHNVSVEPVWENPQPDAADAKPETSKKPSGNTGSGGGPVTPAPDPGPAPDPAPDESTVTLTMPQEDDTVNEYLSRSAVKSVILVPGTAQTKSSTSHLLEVDSGLTVPAGKSLTLRSGVGLNLLENQSMQVSGSVTVNGSFTVYGNLTPASGSSVRAWSFFLDADVPGWHVSGEKDSQGFYTLVPAQAPVVTYTVTFDANGGTISGAQASTAKTDEYGRVSAFPAAVRDGYAFDGWFTEPTGGTEITASTIFTENTTVYAQWTQEDDGGVNWRIEGTTLYIEGAGPMEFQGLGGQPWASEKDNVTAIIIESGVTSISTGVFANHSKVTSVTVPSTVTAIAGQAFQNCVSLESITLPDGVVSIGTHAFAYCDSLTAVSLPGSLKTLEGDTFFSCGSLESVTLPDSITSLGRYTFRECTALTTVVLPSRITALDGTFNGCGKLNNVTIPGTVTSIAALSFNGCDSLTDVYYKGTTAQWQEVAINKFFNDPLFNATIHCTDGDIAGGSAGENVFWSYASATRTLRIWGTGPMTDFSSASPAVSPWYRSYRSVIQHAVVEDGVTSIGGSSFMGLTALADVTIADSVTGIGDRAFSMCGALTSVTIPDGVTAIRGQTFMNCRYLTSVTIPGNVASIDSSAFTGACIYKSDVYYGDTRAKWEAIGFTFGSNVTVHCTDDAPAYTVTFDANGGTPATISVTTGADGTAAFPADPTRTGYTFDGWFTAASGGTRITTSTVFGEDATVYAQWSLPDASGTAGDNVVWEYKSASKTLRIQGEGPINRYPGYVEGGYLVIHTPWKDYNDEILTVIIEDGITAISEYLFCDCTAITSVAIPDSVTRIDSSAFFGCTALTSVTIPNGVTTISSQAFRACKSLTSVTLPDGITTIATNAFSLCDSLTSITIPASVTTISEKAFNNSTALTDVYYTGTEEQWNAITIYTSGNASLTSATIHYNSPITQSIVSDAAPGYMDVPADAWYAEAVAYCREHGLMNGVSATEFAPDATLTRAMTVTVLHRLAGTPAAASTEAFTDVEAGQWYTEAVSWANSQKIVQGYGNGLFGVNDPVTHEQVALILQRYCGDSTVQTIGMDTPEAPATRAEVAATLMQFGTGETLEPGKLSVFSAMDIMCGPNGIAADRDGSLLVTDLYHKQVWRVVSRDSERYAGGATVQDLYGQPVGGYNDAALDGSYFKSPRAIAPFLDGWAVTDTENNVVRLIQSGSVRTVNGATNEKLTVTKLGVAFDHPTGLASDEDGNLYVSDTFSGAIRKITPKGGVSTVAANLSDPTGLAWKDGALYVAETGADRIVKVRDGKVSTVATGFDAPQGVAVGDGGTVYVADTGSGAVKKVSGSTVTTLAERDPAGLNAGLTTPTGLLVQGGKLYICDPFARKVFVYQIG